MGKKLFKRKTFRSFLLKTFDNGFVKFFLFGIIVLLSFSGAIYYIEKDYVVYEQNGTEQRVDDSRSSNIRSFEDSIWWTFVTSTTVGYGDRYPVSTAGRITGILLMFFGVSLMGVITGNMASFFVDRQLKEDKGLKSIKTKNHFIICGWKKDMANVLKDIIQKNDDFMTSEYVLINNHPPEEINLLRSDPELQGLQFVSGDYIDESVLIKANIKKAKKIIVLADQYNSQSTQEMDSRTVMAIITIKSIAKNIYAAAEILDAKFERYLHTANCDEIILTTNYNRSLIANASTGNGISHVISELLNVNSPVSINTADIPKKMVGKEYSDLEEAYKHKPDLILIGILENTGNFYKRKMEAIGEAQKTPNISTLVENLKNVKTLSANRPVFNPDQGYIIQKNSKAIILEGQGA